LAIRLLSHFIVAATQKAWHGGFGWLASGALLPKQATQNRWRSSIYCVHYFPLIVFIR